MDVFKRWSPLLCEAGMPSRTCLLHMWLDNSYRPRYVLIFSRTKVARQLQMWHRWSGRLTSTTRWRPRPVVCVLSLAEQIWLLSGVALSILLSGPSGIISVVFLQLKFILLLLRLRERLRSIVMSTYVCMYVCMRVWTVSVSVCLSARISPEPHAWSLRNFLCMLPMAVARSSSGVVAIAYVMYFRFCGWHHVFFL